MYLFKNIHTKEQELCVRYFLCKNIYLIINKIEEIKGGYKYRYSRSDKVLGNCVQISS